MIALRINLIIILFLLNLHYGTLPNNAYVVLSNIS